MVHCPLCESDRVRQIFEKQGISYQRCLACDFVFSRPNPNPNLANVLEEYEPAYMEYLAESEVDEWNHSLLLRWVGQFGPIAGQKVLDIGCGSGKLVRFLRRRGIEAYGIEPAPALYSRFLAEERFFYQQTIEEFADVSDREEFQILFACDVIEHLEEPKGFLRSATSLLRTGGLLFVSTPDIGSGLARLSGRFWHFFHKYHLSYFSRPTISSLGARCGLHEVGHAHLPKSRSASYVLQYLAEYVAPGSRFRCPERLGKMVLPINLYDIVHVAFKKEH